MFAGQVEKDKGDVLMITNKGFAKRLPVTEITRHARNCKGAKGTEFGVNGSSIVYANYVNELHYKVAIFDKANVYVVETAEVSVENKNNKGKLPKGKRGGIVVEKVIGFKSSADKF